MSIMCDFTVSSHGSVAMVCPNSEDAIAWVEENLGNGWGTASPSNRDTSMV
jgi:hypothetical protein